MTIITQNVDRLHQRAGSDSVLELHGNSHHVVCLNCGYRQSRKELQNLFTKLNPKWKHLESKIDQEAVAPDGDVELPDHLVYSFHVPSCPSCNKGPLKPDVVFFGENLPNERKVQASKLIAQADFLLCCGTTLQTFSSYRLAIQAKEQGSTIAIVNIGPTRADPVADLIINARITESLDAVDKLISAPPTAPV